MGKNVIHSSGKTTLYSINLMPLEGIQRFLVYKTYEDAKRRIGEQINIALSLNFSNLATFFASQGDYRNVKYALD